MQVFIFLSVNCFFTCHFIALFIVQSPLKLGKFTPTQAKFIKFGEQIESIKNVLNV
jgi:hypothetical protein